jgi:hypothetical protein
MLGVLGHFDAATEVKMEALRWQVDIALARLQYVSYAQAEQDCERLAVRLIERFGLDTLRRFRFAAIPRGGFIVLGMLAYILNLEQTQLEQSYSMQPDVPLVVVDDCALSGARFGHYLRRCPERQVIFAHLYSHPDLRAAIEVREAQVRACLSAHDLYDYAPEHLGDQYSAWREAWLARLDDHGYWIGQPGHVCFAWNEPDIAIWNPITQRVERGWHVVPPEFCLKNRSTPDTTGPIRVQVQPEGKGPLKPSAQVLFGEFEALIVIGNVQTGQSFALEGVAADMWRAIVEYGDLEEVMTTLLRDYDVDKSTLQADLQAFIAELLEQGLLEQC